MSIDVVVTPEYRISHSTLGTPKRCGDRLRSLWARGFSLSPAESCVLVPQRGHVSPLEFPGKAIQAGEHVWKLYTWVSVYFVDFTFICGAVGQLLWEDEFGASGTGNNALVHMWG